MHNINPEIVSTILIGTIVLIAIGSFLIVFLLQYQKRKFRHKQEVLNLKETFKNTLLTSQLEIQEQTLKYISQEIHDNIGQVLSLVKLYLATATEFPEQQKDAKINDSKNLVAKAIQDLRALSHSMNTDTIAQKGLVKAIESEVELIRRAGIFRTDFLVTGKVFSLGKQKELILFRIVQESLNNVIKHSSATSLELRVNYEPGRFSLTVSDNGKGFSREENETNGAGLGGLGLKNIHERARLIDAVVTISGLPGIGTSLHIEMKAENEITITA